MPQRISGDRVLLSTSEAAELSGLSREHIQRLLRQKLLEGMKLGHDWLLFEDSLEAFLAQPRKTGPKGPHKKPV
jgi:excisionase family DNA binding protein